MAKLKFAKEKKSEIELRHTTFKILVVDDEKSIHDVTSMALSAMSFTNFTLDLLHAYSAAEAKEIMAEHNDIALALIDVVMETPTAGLDLVEYIRNTLKNEFIRLVIRTGQANDFPEMEVIRHYDINDFKEKTDLTIDRLYTTIRTSIKQYEQILEIQNKYEDTYNQMITNPLTKLHNRFKLNEDCNNNSQQILILIDIVSFSNINEMHGYETGDNVLREFGAFLQTMYADTFNVYHLEGDLFALVSPDDHIHDIFPIVDTIKDDIAQLKIVTNNFNETMDATIGVAYQGEMNLIRKAELALKEARDAGKNRIEYYSEDLKIIKKLKGIHQWGKVIKDSLEDGNALIYYQPIYDLENNVIDKYELLIRIRHNDEIHLPYKFLPTAVHTGQMYAIFQYMFKAACKKAQETGCKFSVNIGDSEFENEGLVEFISDTMHECNINPSLLSIEILEYNSISNNDMIKEKINKINELGIKIVIDDFGINCSNFGQIKDLPVDTIKIDGSFINNLATSENSRIIVKTIKTFADQKNIKIVAEFVCDEGVLEIVKELDIKYGQGFHLGMPDPELAKN